MKRKKNKRKARRHKREARKSTTAGHRKHRTIPGLQQLTRSVAALLAWSQKAEGLGTVVRRSYRSVETGAGRMNARMFVEAVQEDRPILEELYIWAHATAKAEASPAVEEGIALVDSLFSRLKECFDIDIIHVPDTIMATPHPNARAYKFSERFNPAIATSKVLFPGLKQGSKVLAPCEVEQIEASSS